MHDVNAFERQVADEALRMAGPPEPVDDAAIFTAIAATTATRSPKWRFQSMFSATKFVIAGAIVALFGGFLLAGLLTTQQGDEMAPAAVTSSPDTSRVLLPGVDLVAEEVEPGVYRVLSDSAGHDLVAGAPVDLTIAPDGAIVLFEPVPSSADQPLIDTFYVLGQEPMWDAWPEVPGSGPSAKFWFDAAVDHGGSLWARLDANCCEGDRLGRHDGLFGRVDTDAWTLPTWPDGSEGVNGIEVTADGVVWLTQATSGAGPKVARIEDGEWTMLPADGSGLPDGEYHGDGSQFAAGSDGTAWLSTGYNGSPVPGVPGLLHFDGERWAAVDLPIDPRFEYVGPLALGPDGTLWVYAAEPSTRSRGLVQADRRLLRLEDGEWTAFEDVPVLTGPGRFGARLAVDAGGTLWIAFDGWPILRLPTPLDPRHLDGPPRSGEGHGVLSFDGSTWRQNLAGQMVNRVDVAPDGSVWATSLFECVHVDAPCEDLVGGGLFVITPEAVAAGK